MVECLHCRFRYLDPRPDPCELAEFYAEGYPAYALPQEQGRPPSAVEASLQRRFTRVAEQRLALLRRFLPLPWTGLRVLDIGCGNGAFLRELARRHPVEPWGLDIHEATLTALARTFPDSSLGTRLRLRIGDLAGARLPENYFDVISLWHVLEHDDDPVRSLTRVRRWLRPGGLVLAEVPNSAGLIARLCGRYWLGWDLPRHLVHFAPHTLRAAAQRAGLKRTRVLHAYTLNPVCLSPLLASVAIWHSRHQGRKRLKPVAYQRWDGLAQVPLHLVNAVERFLGANGLLLVAHREKPETRNQKPETENLQRGES